MGVFSGTANVSVLLGEAYDKLDTDVEMAANDPQSLAVAGLQSVVLTRDGRFAYAVDPQSNAVVALEVSADGTLSPLESFVDDVVVDGLQGASQVAINPTHDELYVLSPDESAIAVFGMDRDAVGDLDGTLTFQKRVEIAAGATGLVVSPDGETVYVSSSGGLAAWLPGCMTLPRPPLFTALPTQAIGLFGQQHRPGSQVTRFCF